MDEVKQDVLEPLSADQNEALAKAEQEADFRGELAGSNMMFDPSNPEFQRQIKKLQKAIKANAPKHENYRLCIKKCPLFKKNECFKKDHSEQVKCWTEKFGDLKSNPKVTGICTNQGCSFSCSECEKFKVCIKTVSTD